MRIWWEPAGAERREWELDAYGLLSADAEAIESVGGTMWDEFDAWFELLRKGNRRALRAALWVLRRGDGEPGLQFADISVTAREVKYDLVGETEKARMRQRMLDGELDRGREPDLYEFWVRVLGEDPTAGSGKDEPNGSPRPPTGSEPDAAPTGGPSHVS